LISSLSTVDQSGELAKNLKKKINKPTNYIMKLITLTTLASIGLAATSANAATLLDIDTSGTEWLITTSESAGSVSYNGNTVTSTIDRNGNGDVNQAPWSRGVVGGNAYGFTQYSVDGAGAGLAADSTGTWTFSNLAAGQYDIATAFQTAGGSSVRYAVNGAEVFVDQSTGPGAATGPTFSGNYNSSRTNDIFFTMIGSSVAISEGGSITVTIDNSNNAAGSRSKMDSVAITAVPEPTTTALLGLGGLALILLRRK
jgi:hypothetical protein